MNKLVIIGLCVFACVPAAQAARTGPQPDSWILRDITSFRNQTWRYQRTMGLRPTPYAHTAARDPSRRYKLWVRELWQSRATRARRKFVDGPDHRSAWECIHRYEGAWKDGGAPYWGGLQMRRLCAAKAAFCATGKASVS